jgi:hypothetical protein
LQELQDSALAICFQVFAVISFIAAALGLFLLAGEDNQVGAVTERISTTPFLLWHFSPGDKIENCPAHNPKFDLAIRDRI